MLAPQVNVLRFVEGKECLRGNEQMMVRRWVNDVQTMGE